MTGIPKNTYECRECDRTVHIWHRVDSRDGYTGKYTPAKVGCPECECYMDRVTDDG